MKATKIKNVVFIWLLFCQVIVYAQYEGGISDGSAKETLNNTSCSLPDQFYAYFGGNGDGAVNDGILNNATCSTPSQNYAYFGGISDGNSMSSLDNTVCPSPPQFFAYFGGQADGYSSGAVDNTVCPSPPQFYAYFGGNSDGFSSESVDNTVCPNPPQFYAYFGGNADGYGAGESAPVCPTDPPVADFSASSVSICVGDTVNFTDLSTNLPFVWNWTFEQGTPNTSSVQNPTVTYNTEGVFEVSLTAANFNGNDTETKTLYITVNAIPTVNTTTPNSRCDAGTVTLGATASSGATLNWYSAPTGGTLLGTGTSFTTPSISTTTTYYVEATANSCTSARTAVVATVNTTPSITSTTPASRCDAGSVTLSATASAGTLSWYNAPTGGTLVGTGVNYTTPSISTTTSYYVEATSNGCTSPRVEVVATVNTTPSITSTTPAGRCDAGTVTLMATSDFGTIQWYNTPSGGTLLGIGTSYTTSSISSTTTYYVQVSSATCTSVRTAVTATVTPTPSITSTTPNSVCDSGTVTLNATASGGATLNWYNTASGGSILGTGNSFTTPSISTTTSYYVEAVSGSCVSNRVEVIATVNVTPTITSTTPDARCGSGVVTLGATASSGTIRWFNVSSGGSVLATGTSYSVSISTTTTFYVEVTQNGCTSPRTAVVGTVDALPTITSTNGGATICNSGTTTLTATSDIGTLNWYNASTGGTLLGTGTSYTTPTISSSTTYYVEATNGTCTSSRTAVTATVTSTSAPTGNANQTFCSGEIVGSIVVSGTNIIWYDAATGGNVVPNGTAIVDGTTYYASQTVGGCESDIRLAVLMTDGVCLGTEDFVKNIIRVYPNPTVSTLHIENNEQIDTVTIFDITGKQVYAAKGNTNTMKIDVSIFASGTYIVRVTVDRKTEVFKVIKE